MTTKELNEFISPILSTAEQSSIKLTHQYSSIQLKKSRADTKFLNAYAKCSFNSKCQITYAICIPTKEFRENQIQIKVLHANNHEHSDSNSNIKKTSAWIREERNGSKYSFESWGKLI